MGAEEIKMAGTFAIAFSMIMMWGPSEDSLSVLIAPRATPERANHTGSLRTDHGDINGFSGITKLALALNGLGADVFC